MAFGENEENFAAGFWPGDSRFPHAAVYTYIIPDPAGIVDAKILPDAAHFEPALGEFVLLYDDFRRMTPPEDGMAAFFKSAYAVSASLAHWDRATLEGPIPARRKLNPTGLSPV